VKNEAPIFNVRILVKMIDAISVEQRATALNAVDDIALAQEKLSEVRTVLPRYPGD
jgi:hypothetical protein